VRNDAPHRSVFGNYKLAETDGPGSENAAFLLPNPLPVRASRGEGENQCRSGLKSAIGRAVARSFLYRFIAKAFEDAEPEGWQSLCDEAQQAAFWSAVRALAEGAPLNLEPAARRLLDHLKPDGYTVFESDYITCFGHTVRGDCPLNEIEYGDIKADPLFQPHRLADLGAFYAAFGVEIGNDAAERQDHISIELEFMSVLAAKEAYALAHKFDDEQVALVRDAQKKFLREHLGRWTPAFTRRLSRIAGDCALGALAEFTRGFITAECASFNVMPGSEDLLLRPIDDSLETLCASCGITSLPPGATRAPVER
jgi:DMSO reductase family type II enzyme chaperone